MINVTKTYLGDLDKFKRYVEQIYATGWLTNHGPFATALEERLQDYLGVRNVILTCNGTIALQVAYRALGVTGSAVTTPFSFVATSSTLEWEHIRPRFADIDARTWNLDPQLIEASLGSCQIGTSLVCLSLKLIILKPYKYLSLPYPVAFLYANPLHASHNFRTNRDFVMRYYITGDG